MVAPAQGSRGIKLVAISRFFPLFVAQRHRKLRQNALGELGDIRGCDWIAVGLVALLASSIVAYSLSTA